MRILSEAAVGSIIDAGAGSGRFAIPIARRFRHDLVVLSFERQRMVFYELCGNIAANSCGNIFPHNVELGDSVDPDVRRTTLDSFEIVDARLIKFDVEGAEVSLLRGAHATIAASDYPPLLFSCWSDGALSARAGAREELLAEVSGLGYRITSFGPVAFAQHCGKKPIEFTLLI
jgi:hypothetical protein